MESLLTSLPSRIFIALACAALFFVGGYVWKPARRFIMPTILTGYSLLLFFSLYDLTMLACIGVFCLGYGDKSPLRHIFGNGWGRGIWGLLAAISLSLALFLMHHLSMWFFLPYLALNFTLENALKNIPEVIGDPIIGLGLSSIVMLIH